jgi:glycosyltransferase involved in cell wall biosynthesis
MRIGVMLRSLDEKGGVAVYSRNLVRALLDADRLNEYELFYRSAIHLGQFAGQANVREHVISARGKALWDQVAIPRICRDRRVDVLLHPKFTLPLLTRVPSVMVVHGADWFLPEAARFYSRLDRAYMRVFMPLYLRRAAAVISVSRLTTDDFERLFSLPKGKVQTVYFGAAQHFRRVNDAAALAHVRAKYRLPERFILTLSKRAGDTRKNMRRLFDAYERMHDQVPHKLVVGGLGCERFRDDYGLPAAGWGRDVIFPGYLDQADLPAIYSLCDLYLYPSNQEAFPIPIAEAMACGVPIVTSAANGLQEIAGEAAVLVDPGDVGAIAEASLQILTDPGLSSRLSAAGLARSRLFSWATCARSTLEILEAVGGDDAPNQRDTAAGHGGRH